MSIFGRHLDGRLDGHLTYSTQIGGDGRKPKHGNLPIEIW